MKKAGLFAAAAYGGAVKVAFAPYNASTPNLVNGAGLPAGPFRMKVNLQSK